MLDLLWHSSPEREYHGVSQSWRFVAVYPTGGALPYGKPSRNRVIDMAFLALVAGLCACIVTAVVVSEHRRNSRVLRRAHSLRKLLLDLHERHGEATFYQLGSHRAVVLYHDFCSLIDLQSPALLRTVWVDEVDAIEFIQVTDSMAKLILRLKGGERLNGPEISDPTQLARGYAAFSKQIQVTFPRTS